MPKNRQPWPMKWIVLAILLAIVPYTIVTLQFRKEAPAFQPYEDLKNRANVARLLAAGYQRIPLDAQRPADAPPRVDSVAAAPAPGGLPTELRTTLVEPPLLPAEITGVSASPTANTLQSYPVHFSSLLPTDQQHLGGADLFLKENDAVLVPTFERVDGSLQTRTREAIVLVTIPAGALKPGNYTFTLVGEKSSRTWPLEVR